MARGWNVARLTVAALLVWGAYWAALPWIDGMGWNVVIGADDLAAALWVVARG